MPVNECEIGFINGALLKLRGDVFVRGIGFGDDEQAGRVGVKAMNDAGSRAVRVVGGKFVEVKNKTIDERSGGLTRARMHRQFRAFIDDDKRIVFINDVERRVFRRDVVRCERRRRIEFEFDAFARAHAVRSFNDSLIDQNGFITNQALDSRATKFRDASGEKRIEARSNIVSVDFKFACGRRRFGSVRFVCQS